MVITTHKRRRLSEARLDGIGALGVVFDCKPCDGQVAYQVRFA
jgi:hypothetical protein